MIDQSTNLNLLSLQDHRHPRGDMDLEDPSREAVDGSATVYFRNLQDRLIEQIRKSSLIVGCVAWLTSEEILRALAAVPHGVSIVVQKEDFLRPDVPPRSNWKKRLRDLYEDLKRPSPERHQFPGLAGELSVACDPIIQPVRCMGNHNRDKNPAFPRMHNKFLVFCEYTPEQEDEGISSPFDDDWDGSLCNGKEPPQEIRPRAVWTGSLNFTKNATQSLENALILTDPSIVQAYYEEWGQILALSEELDWTSDWCAPEWRLGT